MPAVSSTADFDRGMFAIILELIARAMLAISRHTRQSHQACRVRFRWQVVVPQAPLVLWRTVVDI